MFFTLVPMCELVHCEAIIGAMALQQPWLRPRSLEEATKVELWYHHPSSGCLLWVSIQNFFQHLFIPIVKWVMQLQMQQPWLRPRSLEEATKLFAVEHKTQLWSHHPCSDCLLFSVNYRFLFIPISKWVMQFQSQRAKTKMHLIFRLSS